MYVCGEVTKGRYHCSFPSVRPLTNSAYIEQREKFQQFSTAVTPLIERLVKDIISKTLIPATSKHQTQCIWCYRSREMKFLTLRRKSRHGKVRLFAPPR